MWVTSLLALVSADADVDEAEAAQQRIRQLGAGSYSGMVSVDFLLRPSTYFSKVTATRR
jgi:hypothetical protein